MRLAAASVGAAGRRALPAKAGKGMTPLLMGWRMRRGSEDAACGRESRRGRAAAPYRS